jgi:hypothetical protein
LQRNEEVRLRLIESAGKIIGKYGYSGCSISRVTVRAKIAAEYTFPLFERS